MTPGMTELLELWSQEGYRLACLSNDVVEWSEVLRRRFGLTRWIDIWVISGDIGLRKPDPLAYRRLLDALGTDSSEVLFMDDRARTVAAATELGVLTVQVTGIDTTAEAVRSWR
jgi:HAD superfamily hydrolase (TIGR01509 family)